MNILVLSFYLTGVNLVDKIDCYSTERNSERS